MASARARTTRTPRRGAPQRRLVAVLGSLAAALLVMGTGLSGGVAQANPVAPVTQAVASTLPVGCTPVVILTMRGTDEGRTALQYPGTALHTNGWEGPMLQRLLARFAQYTGTGGFVPAATIPVIGVSAANGYPAVGIEDTTFPWDIPGAIHASANRGVAAANNLMAAQIGAQPVGCPSPKFVLVGYSQGAMVAHALAASFPSLVAGVIALADPLQRPNAPGNQGAGADGDGVLRWLAGDAYRDWTDTLYTQGTPVDSLCHAADPICHYSWWTGTIQLAKDAPDHKNYLRQVGSFPDYSYEAQQLGSDLGRLADAAYQAALPLAATDATGMSALADPAGPDDPADPLDDELVVYPASAGEPTTLSVTGAITDTTAAVAFDPDYDPADPDFTPVPVGPDGTTESAIVHTFDTPGAHTVAARITDDDGSESIVTQTVTVEPEGEDLPGVDDPTDASTALDSVLVGSASAAAGTPVEFSVPELGAGDQFAVRLVPTPADGSSPWLAEPMAVLGPFTGSTATATLPADLASGSYAALFVTEDGRHGESAIDVVAPATASVAAATGTTRLADTGLGATSGPAGGLAGAVVALGLVALGIGILVPVARRRRRV